MSTPWNGKRVGVVYRSLPHWIVDCGCYAVTLRCAGTLPVEVQNQLLQIGKFLREIDSSSPEAEVCRRQHFGILEKYLDASEGFAPFKCTRTAKVMHELLQEYDKHGLSFGAWVVMPNHLHLLTNPMFCADCDAFFHAWQRFKQGTAVTLNQHLRRSGTFWQSDWYDRWVRDRVEYERWLKYFAKNPVSAGLVGENESYPYLNVSGGVP